jgi:predicted naringenin-chalcone synthase
VKPVYIAASTTRLPHSLAPEQTMDILYPPSLAEGRPNRLARRAARAVGIASRPTVRDPAAWPAKQLARSEYRPLAWCSSIMAELASLVSPAEIGFASVAYNISSDIDVLPSLSARVAGALGLALEVPPDERAFLGCAGGVFSLDAAVRYCRDASKGALVCCFDQCSWLVNPIHDVEQPAFQDHLRASLLFSDGAAGLSVVPAGLRSAFRRPLMRILDVHCDFVASAAVRMSEGSLRLTQDLEADVPGMVAQRVIRPMLARHGLAVADVDEWALHQGGRPLLDRFGDPDILGLSEQQRARALELFSRYGNLSAPSWMFVLDSFLHDSAGAVPGRKGMIVAFGAGFYVGAALYEWEAP